MLPPPRRFPRPPTERDIRKKEGAAVALGALLAGRPPSKPTKRVRGHNT